MAIEEHSAPDPRGLGPVPRREPVARTAVGERRHRVHAFAGRAHDAIDELRGGDGAAFCSVAELSPLETRESIIEITRLQARLEAVKCRLLDHGTLVGVHLVPDPDDGPVTRPLPATTPAAWLAGAVRAPIGAA